MVQKEVAERLTVKPGKMNLLAAATQVWADISIIEKLKPRDFSPPPKVESAVVKLATRVSPLATREEGNDYYKFIKIAFKQPRKTLLNNIADGYDMTKQEALLKLINSGFNENTRPQELDISQLTKLSALFSS